MATATLDVWLYGELVAVVDERRTGKFRLTYTRQALERWDQGRPLLSVSMPLVAKPYPPGVVGPFLEGLLPEGEARGVLEEAYGLRRGDVAGLLAQIGRDCAGAVIVMSGGEPPPSASGSAEPIDDDELARALRILPERPLGDDDRVRVSLAGQQGKLLLVRRPDGGWARPVNGVPSTHILKPEPREYPGAAVNEVVCLRLARQLGLTDIEAQLLDVDGIPVVAVARYDRTRRDDRIERLHQEDLCQALSIDVGARGRGKYESDGGPSFADVGRLLDVHNGDPVQTGRLAESVVFTVAIGNADAHGKNLSLLLPPNGKVRLAPLYDLISTVFYPQIHGPGGHRRVSTELGMFVNGQTDIDEVALADIRREVARWHLTSESSDPLLSVLERLPAALEAVATQTPQAPDGLLASLHRRVAHLSSGRTAAGREPSRGT